MSDCKINDGDMSTLQLFQQVALLGWLRSDSEESKDLLTTLTGARVMHAVHNRLTRRSQLDAYKRECILSVADYVRRHPRASQQELSAEVEKHIKLFAARVQMLDSSPLL
uniref:Si:ch211-191j22.3 n=1 Tax=Paramormyrops kingsleyae TaxID=1676925 RepID=A0A3B3RRL8_9TELE